MFKKTSLAMAIAATLIAAPVSYAGSLKNYYGCQDTNIGSTVPTCFVTVNEIPSGTYNIVRIPDADDGIKYGCHLFGSGDAVLPAPGTTEDYHVAAQFTTTGTLSGEIQVTAEIENADFDTVKLGYIEDITNTAADTDLTIQGISAGNANGDCNTDSKCTWLLKDLKSIADPAKDSVIENGDKLMLFYRLKNADLENNPAKLTMKIGTVLHEDIMGKADVVAATCEDPIEVSLAATNNSDIKVSVEAESKQFITQRSAAEGPDPEFLNGNEVIFGYLSIKNVDGVKADDGYTPWALGDTSKSDAFDAAHDAANDNITQLAITEGGQFAASLTGSKGRVYLDLGVSGSVDADSVTELDAFWELDNNDLTNMTNYSENIGDIPIVIKADGDNVINVTPDDLPKAILTLSYAKDESKKNIIYPPEPADGELLSKYPQDGTSCWVYNIPGSGAKDIFNLRVTNDSGVDGVIKGTLYGVGGGSPVFSGENLLTPLADYAGVTDPELEKGKTVRITAGDLESFSGTWDGRGTMLISSTLPKLEVMALLREKNNPPCASCSTGNVKPLTNLSTGAHGVACQN